MKKEKVYFIFASTLLFVIHVIECLYLLKFLQDRCIYYPMLHLFCLACAACGAAVCDLALSAVGSFHLIVRRFGSPPGITTNIPPKKLVPDLVTAKHFWRVGVMI